MMAEIGTVNEISRDIEWKISAFSMLSGEVDKFYCSSNFRFAKEDMFFGILPNGLTTHVSVGYIGVFLARIKFNPLINLAVSLGLRTSDGQCIGMKEIEPSVHTNERACVYTNYYCILRTELLRRKTELLPSDILTVICKVSLKQRTGATQSQDSTRTVQNVEQPTSKLPLCIICFNNERNIVFQPCGHLVACRNCTDYRMRECPVCRMHITSKINTYIS